MRQNGDSPARPSAFTLIELMVVLALIAILSAVILPEMRGTFEDAVLRSSARQLIAVFGLAGSRAVSLSQVQRVRLDQAAGRYVLEAQAGRAHRGAPFTAVRDGSGTQGTLDHRITVEIHRSETDEPGVPLAPPGGAVPDAIAFYPDGTADAVELTLRDRAGFGLTLRMNPVTARVQILERPRP